eukprot:gene24405-31234_t
MVGNITLQLFLTGKIDIYGTDPSPYIQSIIDSVVIQHVAVWLNDMENHRTDTQYEDALVYKIFLFQFVNSYKSLFFT